MIFVARRDTINISYVYVCRLRRTLNTLHLNSSFYCILLLIFKMEFSNLNLAGKVGFKQTAEQATAAARHDDRQAAA